MKPIINDEMKKFINDNLIFMTNEELAENLDINLETLVGYLYRNRIKRQYPMKLFRGERFEYCESITKKYKVSNKGRIIIVKNNRLLKYYKQKDGKVYAQLYIDKNTTVRKLVAKLVAETFIPNPENRIHVGYKNENVEDLDVENLEWI